MAANRVIGRNNALPWHLPADLQHFKTLTMGHAVILGRTTFESIGRVLPGRRWVVLTRQPAWHHPGVTAAHDLDHALRDLAGDAEVFIAGGAEVYRNALSRADRVYLTLVHAELEGDARFPDLDQAEWTLLSEEYHDPDARNAFGYTFQRYEHLQQSR